MKTQTYLVVRNALTAALTESLLYHYRTNRWRDDGPPWHSTGEYTDIMQAMIEVGVPYDVRNEAVDAAYAALHDTNEWQAQELVRSLIADDQ